jgi:hypothetical protein
MTPDMFEKQKRRPKAVGDMSICKIRVENLASSDFVK